MHSKAWHLFGRFSPVLSLRVAPSGQVKQKALLASDLIAICVWQFVKRCSSKIAHCHRSVDRRARRFEFSTLLMSRMDRLLGRLIEWNSSIDRFDEAKWTDQKPTKNSSLSQVWRPAARASVGDSEHWSKRQKKVRELTLTSWWFGGEFGRRNEGEHWGVGDELRGTLCKLRRRRIRVADWKMYRQNERSGEEACSEMAPERSVWNERRENYFRFQFECERIC